MSRIFLAAFSLLSLAVHAYPQNITSAGEEVKAVYISNWTSSDAANLSNLEWIDITKDPSRANRIGDDHCMIVKEVTVTTDSRGTWWTDWCRVGGLETNRRGDSIGISQSQQQSTTLHAGITITTPMISSLKATIGYTVTNTVGWGKNIGCENQDGVRHGLWLQENLGWAWQTITESFSQTGPSWCSRAPAPYVYRAQVNWPDPNKYGSREIHYICEWDSVGGRLCNFWDPHHI